MLLISARPGKIHKNNRFYQFGYDLEQLLGNIVRSEKSLTELVIVAGLEVLIVFVASEVIIVFPSMMVWWWWRWRTMMAIVTMIYVRHIRRFAVCMPPWSLELVQILVDAWLNFEQRWYLFFLFVRIQIDNWLFVRMQVRTQDNVLLIFTEMIDFRLWRCVVGDGTVRWVSYRMHIWPMRFDNCIETVLPIRRVMHTTNGSIWLQNTVMPFNDPFTFVPLLPLRFHISCM